MLMAAVLFGQNTVTHEFCESFEIVESEELLLLASIINAEAEGEPFEGKLGVGTVVLNRGQDIRTVIFKRGQFDGVNGRFYPTSASIRAAHLVLSGYRSFPPDVLYFANPKTSTDTAWLKKLKLFKAINNHNFYVKP